MPSQQVIEKLEELQKELEKVDSAVKHIDEASKVAKAASDILNKIPELLAELKSVEEKHRKELQKDLKEKIDAIEKQLQSLLAELKDKAKQLSQFIDETKKLEKAINYYIVEIRKINFPERLDKIDNQISSININVGNLQTSILRSQEKIEKGFEETSQNLNAKTSEIINHLIEENKLLKKEVKTNRMIQIIGLVIIISILIYILINKQHLG